MANVLLYAVDTFLHFAGKDLHRGEYVGERIKEEVAKYSDENEFVQSKERENRGDVIRNG